MSTGPMRLRVEGREILVPTTRFGGCVATYCTIRLRQPSSDRLVLQPSLGDRLLAGIFLTLGLGVFALGYFGITEAVAVSEIAGLVFALFGLWLFIQPARHEFDRARGRWTRRRLRTRTVRPLTDVLAVQLLTCRNNARQLNLVLDDEAQRRCKLAYHQQARAARRHAERLADFLGVPLLHQVAEGLEPMTVSMRGRDRVVERTPLPGVAASFRTRALVERRPGCLVLRAAMGARLFDGLFVVGGLGIAVVGLVGLFSEGPARWENWIALPFGAVFAAPGIYCFGQLGRWEFDRDAGVFTLRRWRTTKERPLTDILAVQLLDGGDHTGGDGPGFRTWQVNLIVDDEAEPRCNLSNDGNLEAARRHAAGLAEFLGVPLLDHVAEETVAAA